MAEVTGVVWEEFAAESTPLDTCTNNGGKRIFPDKRFVVDPSANIRNKVNLKATLNPAVNGCDVQFRTWDVDDPFDQNNSGLANVQVIDSDASGPDNRGSDPGVVTGTGTTDARGVARFTVTVSMQPGNNYRGAASGFAADLSGTTQTQAETNAPPPRVKFTDMLTVWRKLHVELDSMGPVTGNEIVTTFTDIVGTGTALTEARGIPSIDDGSANLDKQPPGNGRFENGTMIVGTPPSTITIAPITANGNTRVVFGAASLAGLPFSAIDNDSFGNGTMSGTITQIAKAGANFVWTLNVTAHNEDPIDWPDFVGGTLTVGGGSGVEIVGANGAASQLTTGAMNTNCRLHDDDDDTLLPRMPDVSGMAAAYASAYVVPVYDVGDNNMNVPFVRNVPLNDGENVAALDWDSRALNSAEYWVVYVLSSFQGQASNRDRDPDSERATLGVTPSVGGGSLVFLEVHQAHEGQSNPAHYEQVTIIHETGHAAGDSDAHPVTENNDIDSSFVAEYLVYIRSAPKPSP